MSFTLRVTLLLLVAAAAAVAVAPLTAFAVASLGFHFPFPRIFDRTLMAALLVALLVQARALGLTGLISAGFARPRSNLPRAMRGFVVALAAIAVLWLLAMALGAAHGGGWAAFAVRAPGAIAGAIVIGVIEETFFRVFLLQGMAKDLGSKGALLASSVVYALAHLVRSPARYYLTKLDFTAGAHNLVSSLGAIGGSAGALPTLLGLFLLGIVLGEAFLATGTAYFSVGFHAGLVFGLRWWRTAVKLRKLPGWLRGYGQTPLVSGVAGWALALAILFAIRPLAGRLQPHAPMVSQAS